MENAALALFSAALDDAVILTLPVVLIVAAAGVVIGIVQTIVQVQDQNVAFAPKLAVVALLTAGAGPYALDVLRSLFDEVVSALPALVR